MRERTPLPAPGPPPTRRRPLLRVVLAALLLVPVLGGIGLWVATRSWFIVLVAAPGLEQRLGGEVRIGDAAYRGDGTFVFEDLRLRAEGLRGPGAQVLHVARAAVRVDLAGLLRGPVRVRDVVLHDVLLRLSEDRRDPGRFNLAGLDPDWSTTSDRGPAVLPPSVRIVNADIEVGQHVGSDYTLVGRRRFSGEMTPAGGEANLYRFRLNELDANGISLGRDGLRVDGRWNVETMEHRATIEGLELDERTYRMCPQVARLWWDRMEPEGPVGRALIEWKKGEPFLAELILDRVALTIPIAAHDLVPDAGPDASGAMPHLPRMFVESGAVRLEGNQLSLDNLDGELGAAGSERLVEMPYHVNLNIHDLPTFDWRNPQEWMERVLSTAPFEMRVRMRNFRLEQRVDPASSETVELPRQVEDLMHRFNLSGWTLTTEVDVTRDPPAAGADGAPVAAPVRTRGQAYISDASGAFSGFPYPLDDVEAFIEFDNDRVTIHYLTGRGSDDAAVRMSGWIAPPGRNAEIRLTLTARDVPLDTRFRKGLKDGQRTTFDVMLHRESYELLREEGLLPDAGEVAEAREKRRELADELTRLTRAGADADSARLEKLKRELGRQETIIETAPFELGGLIDLDLRIHRLPEGGAPTITGTVDIHRAGVVYGRFPYPFQVLGGALEVAEDRIVIVDGLDAPGIPIATPGGGRGRVTGEVRLVRDDEGTHVEPALAVTLRNDYLSDRLYAALPFAGGDKSGPDPHRLRPVPRRSLVARLLAGAGIQGWVNHTGVISADEDGRPTFDFSVEVFDARAEPTEEFFQTMVELDLPSPRGVALDDVRALVGITPDAVRLVDFSGRSGEARIAADALVNLEADPVETEVNVAFDDLALERYMVELTPAAGLERTADLWDRYRPEGRYDAQLTYRARGRETELSRLVIQPETLRVMVDGEPLWIVCGGGRIRLHDRQVSVDDLVLELEAAGRHDGTIAMEGSYGLSPDRRELWLAGSWKTGQLGCPLIPEALALMGADDEAARYRSHDPAGTFDAEFFYRSATGGREAEYGFTVRPRTVGFHVNDTPVFAEIEEGSEIAFTNGRIVLRDVAGEHAGGSFRVDGAADVSGPLDVDVGLEYVGRPDSPQLLALLPKTIRSVLRFLDLQAAEPLRLSDARLHVVRVEPPAGAPGWGTSFDGVIETTGGSFAAGGVEFTDIDGVFELSAEHGPETPPRLDIVARAERLRAAAREMTDVETRVSLIDDGEVLSIPDLRADAYGGVVSGRVLLGLDEGGPYEAALDLGGVSLQGLASPEEAEEADGGDGPHGEVYGSFRVAGRRGDPAGRRGRGALRVAYGRMADLPVTLRLLQLFELMPPLAGTLDFADVAFYIDGEYLVFERIFLECPTLQLVGEGRMSYPGLELDLRMRTRGTVPVVRDIVAAVSDQLFVVEISGPIGDPKAKLIALPGVSQGPPPKRSVQARAP